MKHYSKEETAAILPGWEYENIGIEKDFLFVDFNEAFAFMTRVALFCAIDDHHPEWTNVYNKVHIRLNTHSEKAVTDKDLKLATQIDSLVNG